MRAARPSVLNNFAIHTQVIARIEPGKRVVVYGSLALGGPDDRYYLTRTSDADLAIEVPSGHTCTSKQRVPVLTSNDLEF